MGRSIKPQVAKLRNAEIADLAITISRFRHHGRKRRAEDRSRQRPSWNRHHDGDRLSPVCSIYIQYAVVSRRARSEWSPCHCREARLLGREYLFVLSGFVLYLPYRTKKRAINRLADFPEFYWHRAARLLPLYYVVVLVTVALHAKSSAGSHAWYLELGGLLSTLFIFVPHGFMPPLQSGVVVRRC